MNGIFSILSLSARLITLFSLNVIALVVQNSDSSPQVWIFLFNSFVEEFTCNQCLPFVCFFWVRKNPLPYKENKRERAQSFWPEARDTTDSLFIVTLKLYLAASIHLNESSRVVVVVSVGICGWQRVVAVAAALELCLRRPIATVSCLLTYSLRPPLGFCCDDFGGHTGGGDRERDVWGSWPAWLTVGDVS